MKDEQALSEVIGFLMIVALLAMLFSMYLLYVVPLQGRDTEIAHMDQVKEQFTGIVLDINSLIVNQKLDYPIQRTISLGSGQGGMSGAFSILPMQTYTGSSGTLRVDTNPSFGMITILTNGVGIREEANIPTSIEHYDLDDSDSTIDITPMQFYLDYHVANSDPANNSDVIYLNATDWCVTVQVIPQYDPNYLNITQSPIPGELTLTIEKEHKTTLDNVTISKYVSSSNNPYRINLYDWGYGLADKLLGNYTLTYQIGANAPKNLSDNAIGQIAYSEYIPEYPENRAMETEHPLSIFEFQSNNKNWVNQNYQYQWGAAFVKQSGIASLLKPPIDVSRENKENSFPIKVALTDAVIQTYSPDIPSTSISGTQNNPIIIKLEELNSTINGWELLNGPANAKYLVINAGGFTDIKEKEKWKSVFNTIKDGAQKYKIDNKEMVITDDINLNGDSTDVSLIIASDRNNNNFDLATKIASVTSINDLIEGNGVDDGDGVGFDRDGDGDSNDGLNDISENGINIQYQRANISISLHNIGTTT